MGFTMNASKTLVLFVHGLGGTGIRTWGKFPHLIANDNELVHVESAVFDYPSKLNLRRPLRSIPRIQLVADALHSEIRVKYMDHGNIVLAAHSLGGIVARRYLTDRALDRDVSPVSKLILFATPNDGAGLAALGKVVGWRQPQIRQLCRRSDFIDGLNLEWEKLDVGGAVDVTYVVAAGDAVVTPTSARGLPGVRSDVHTLMGVDHRGCVKPKNSNEMSYQVLKQVVLKTPTQKPDPPSAAQLKRLRVVGFDLDGTLLRGLTFSWTCVWEHLGFPPDHHRQGMLKHRRGEWTYREWCDWAVSCYRARGLTRGDLEQLADNLELTKNLREGISMLKRAGFVVALISGGIDTFLYRKLPDARELFDAIYINEMEFDSAGVISGVKATAYDFEGKAAALEEVAKKHGASMSQTVFVGDGFNDASVSLRAGLSVAYPPSHIEQSSASAIEIGEDNLIRVVNEVLRGR
jgi:HAD superfamily phosphoserine phosphatase-like hydrolase